MGRPWWYDSYWQKGQGPKRRFRLPGRQTLVWVVLIFVGFILPKKMIESKRIVLLGVFAVSAALWGILGQLYFILEWSFPHGIILFLSGQAHPLRFLYAGYLLVVGMTVLLAAYVAIFSERFQRGFIS